MAIGVDIGGTSTKLGVVQADGRIERWSSFATLPPREDFLARLGRAVIELLDGEPDETPVGVSVAGFLDARHTWMFYNPNLPWLERVPLQAELAAACGRRVVLEVDSNAAAVGEYRFGAGAASKRFLFLSVGTGIGGGFLEDGAVVRLAHECIGDVGHVIVEPGGALCTCGGRGCAEAVLAALRGSDQASLNQAGETIGLLAASLAAIFFPDRIALGGGVCEASDIVVQSAQESFARNAGALARRGAVVTAAALGARAALAGAGWTAGHPDT